MKKSLILVVAFLLLCSSMVFAQEDETDYIESYTGYNVYNFDIVGGGTRAKGMGNAYIGVSNDITGGSWNPAGLYEIDETKIGISWFSLSPKGVTTTQSFTNNTNLEHAGSFSNMSSLNFVSPIRIKGHPFVFSLNVGRNFDDFDELSYQVTSPGIFITRISEILSYVDTNDVDYTRTFRREGGLNSLNIGFGTRFYDNISFGATINIYSGKTLLNKETHLIIENARYQVVQFGTVTVDTVIVDTNKFSGANFTFGFMYNGDKLDAGLTIRTPFNLNENREQSISTDIYIIDPETGSTPTPIYVDQILKGDLLFKYEMPLMVGAGVGYQVNENWLLAADVEYRGFSGKKIHYRTLRTVNPNGENDEDFFEIDPLWNNSFSVRFGSEYMKSFDFADVPIRTGFGYVPVPGPSVTTDDTGNLFYNSVVNYNFTAGTGLHFELIHLDLAYVYSISDSENGYYNGTSDFKNHNITVSFSGVF